MGSFCEGDYCVLAHYAPRWGTAEWGEPRIVKGCMNGKMLRSDVRSHCETADEEGNDVFTCFCDNKDYCNGDKAAQKLEIQPVQLVTCVCEGPHCNSETCIGELCSYVINHRTKDFEQGCVNASVPLIERRSVGACMVPPITGAMHHTVAKSAEDLLFTESCVCGSDYCNAEKPKITVKENMKCTAFAKFEAIGSKAESRNISCNGEYCFKAQITSDIGHMKSYSTMGCASFTEDAELAEELNPVGCAKFESEKVSVEACFKTDDKRAIGRARANQEMTTPRRRPSKAKSRPKPKMEVSYDDDEEEEEKPKKPQKQKPKPKEEPEEVQEVEEKEETGKNDKEEETENEEPETETPEEEEEETTTAHYIFERPTMAPVPEDSNVALISVFLLLIVLIALSGLVWKLELHKKLFRSSYDTVAGG
uniref:Uncharacterized protein n=1 Tax=Panagrolaimus sp. JU765 TaxID=591449 RepID=A0AC34RNS8_9BILA